MIPIESRRATGEKHVPRSGSNLPHPMRTPLALLCIVLALPAARAQYTTAFSPSGQSMVWYFWDWNPTPYSTTNYQNFLSAYNPGGTNQQYGLINFDLSSQTGATITSATLSVTTIPNTTAGYEGYAGNPSGAGGVNIFANWSPWDASTVYWNNHNGQWSGVGGGTTPWATNNTVVPGNQQVTLTFDVTALVQAWAAGSQPNYGFALSPVNAGTELAFYALGGALTVPPGAAPSLSVISSVPEPDTAAALAGLLVFALGLLRQRRQV